MSKSRKSLAAVALVVFASFAFTGCIKLNVDATFSPDGTVSGELISAIDASVYESFSSGFGGDEEFDPDQIKQDAIDEVTASIEDSGIDADLVKVEEYDQDGFVGTRIVFEDLPTEDFAALWQATDSGETDTGTEVTIDSTSDSLRIEFPFEGTESGGDSELDIPEEVFASADVSLSFTMPGEITDSQGFEIDGCTASWTWDPKDTAGVDLIVESGTEGCSASTSSDSLLLYGSIAAIVVGVLIAVVLLLKGRGGKSTPPAAPSEFGTPYAPPPTPPMPAPPAPDAGWSNPPPSS